MATERGKLYQDRLYGTKVLSPLAVAIIDTAEFQRLATLKQLGFADVAYRSAHHTRFEHSVGTYMICRTLMRRIVQNHDRLVLPHPGREVSARFATYPDDWLSTDGKVKTPSNQARWRGVQEVVSAAALLHDLGHVPFGHTLEDEFTGIYDRHDNLAGSRLYEMMFNESSDLAKVFSDDLHEPWIRPVPGRKKPGITNAELGRLIYVVLNWKDRVDPATAFEQIIDAEIENTRPGEGARERLENLRLWHRDFSAADLFHPFMSDVVGNTICADLLDYLPRDRRNLGMEARRHTRLQRYLTIREGTLYAGEGKRLSIMVTRKGRGGQRRDVTTAVLDIMRERYEMAERVYYHHKKAAASTMLAKLAEIAHAAGKRPRDDDAIYPAPWTDGARMEEDRVPHMLHLSDAELIAYLGRHANVNESDRSLQSRLHRGLRFQRKSLYRTLLVLDIPLVNLSRHSIAYFSEVFRGKPNQPSNEARIKLESELSSAASGTPGEVLIYCPSAGMQAKEVDVRVELQEGKILPLRTQVSSFASQADLSVLQQYYTELWRAYVFVTPELFADQARCRSLVDRFCEALDIPKAAAYGKVRKHDFQIEPGVAARDALSTVQQFADTLPFETMPREIVAQLLAEASGDQEFLDAVRNNADASPRLSALFEIVALEGYDRTRPDSSLNSDARTRIKLRCDALRNGTSSARPMAARDTSQDEEGRASFSFYQRELIDTVVADPEST